jgi:GntR family transcriptional regulator
MNTPETGSNNSVTSTEADPVGPPGDHGSIAADLLRRIDIGEFLAGTRLPSEANLATEYQVSRGRVRTALAALARRGLIVSRRNSGWVVQGEHQTQTLDRMRSFAQWAADHGRVATGRIVDRETAPADAREARLLRIRLGEPVLRFIRLRALDGRNVMIERSTWAPWVTPLVEVMPDDIDSTTSALGLAGIEVVVGHHRIEAVAASSEHARLLGVRRSSPLLQVERVTETHSGRRVEIGVDRYVPGVIAFEIRAGEGGRRSAEPGLR